MKHIKGLFGTTFNIRKKVDGYNIYMYVIIQTSWNVKSSRP